MSLRHLASFPMGTPAGEFQVHAYQGASGFVHLALVKGRIEGESAVLGRVHSECLTGDALGSLRCDCGTQLQVALRRIAAEGRGVLVYVTGHEGRGIGLVDKLRAYVLQDQGLDTVEANLRLARPADARDYGEAAQVLQQLGVISLRLMTNNPAKRQALQRAGLPVEEVVPLTTTSHLRNLAYLRTKTLRFGHLPPGGSEVGGRVVGDGGVDVSELLGTPREGDGPYVLLKYAQTLDGRIATRRGDARWISGEAERRVSHALRAACDAVMVGVGTVINDDPQLTVRMVAGVSPVRVVLDSRLRIPLDARVLEDDAPTVVITTPDHAAQKRWALRRRQVTVRVVPAGPGGVDLPSALAELRALGVRSLLVEGGAGVITSLLSARLAHRAVVAVAPLMIGDGVSAVGDLGTEVVSRAVRLEGCATHRVGEDLLISGDLAYPEDARPRSSSRRRAAPPSPSGMSGSPPFRDTGS